MKSPKEGLYVNIELIHFAVQWKLTQHCKAAVCVCVCVCVCVYQSLCHILLFETPWTVGHQAPLSMDSPGKNTGVGAIPFSRRSSQPRDQTQVSCIAGRFFTIWAAREALYSNKN